MIGIDLGTTFSAIAWMNPHGKPEIIASREGERTTPSVIFFEDNGLPIVGREARNQAIVAPGRTVRFVKREMGNPSYRFAVDGKEYFPEDLSALILKKLKGDAEAFLGQPVTAAVISVPAYFKDAQREATRQAGRIAGLEVTRIGRRARLRPRPRRRHSHGSRVRLRRGHFRRHHHADGGQRVPRAGHRRRREAGR
jgi:molecular chaperone DnaK